MISKPFRTFALNTYLLYLRWLLIKRDLDETRYQNECKLVRDSLAVGDKAHFQAFLNAWP